MIMRSMALFSLLLCATACDDDTGTPAAVDMSVLADLSAGGSLTCAAALTCVSKCTAANLQTCSAPCSKVTTAAQSYFDALNTCVGTHCVDADGGSGLCGDPSSAACTACLGANCASQVAACQAH